MSWPEQGSSGLNTQPEGKHMGFDFSLPGLGRPESSRPKRVAEAIQNELSVLLLQKTRDPRLQDMTISRVEVTADLKLAKVYFTLPPDGKPKETKAGLNAARGFFRSQLAAKLNLRYTPALVFYHDLHHVENERLDEVFRQLEEERKDDEDPV
jgi:ribosome-binding factor A